ncbi:hypothetical protein [Pseudomonas aeruginosa]|uniref:hypothetical protein n=1 Tax=Pseudomonas aeruginosa TaxID=287 RepID=UPI000B49024A|nr:hypothetical protein [Pseudomonas aeruginosa]EIU3098423.1 hypothetical protein [Pseudomonas aeruginosa]EKX5129363.1 hypothetical protein [Pseudomonas aeruginosa]MCK1856647.1 hypothetical protein [Pseudomonas aeruginosa]MCK1868879.1 hypothetical protein [Pseudomonas aeruginosa]MCK1874241.1 hypothetical protein [Pseudomonas aeruginosa]
MTQKKKADQQASPQVSQINNITVANAPTKTSRVLAYLIAGGSLNRFEAERIGDHCLNSTISALAHQWGIQFQRIAERVPTRWGKNCDVVRYSIPVSQFKRAQRALTMMTINRRAAA